MGDLEEMNKERVRAMLSAVDASLASGSYVAADEFFAADCVTHSHPRSHYQGDRPRSGGGHEERHRQLDEARASLGERRHEPVSQVAEGDMVVTTVEVTLKYTGPFAGIASTGKEVRSHQVFVHRLDDGKITDVWSYGDLLGVLRQLEATLSLP
jgi:ketosteroid isomerase-like protein